MKKPICVIGPVLKFKEFLAEKIEEKSLQNADILEVFNKASIEEIKDFRYFLMKNNLKQKIGVIYFFNLLDDMKQSVLLKIFEENLDAEIFIHASSFINFTIQTRCDLFYLNNGELSNESKWIMNYIISAMKDEVLTEKMMNGFDVFIQTLNLYENNFINNDEKNVILKDLL